MITILLCLSVLWNIKLLLQQAELLNLFRDAEEALEYEKFKDK